MRASASGASGEDTPENVRPRALARRELAIRSPLVRAEDAALTQGAKAASSEVYRGASLLLGCSFVVYSAVAVRTLGTRIRRKRRGGK